MTNPHPVAVAVYTSRPRTSEVAAAVRLMLCDQGDIDCNRSAAPAAQNSRPVRRVFVMIGGERGLAARRASGKLTTLKRDTLALFAGGRSYTGIAAERGNSTVTVRNTINRIQDRLGIRTKQELVIWAVRNGLMDDVAVGGDAQPAAEGQ